MASFAFRISGIAPTHDPAWRSAPEPMRKLFWAEVVKLGLQAKDRDLARGLDKDGVPMVPISRYTREHRRSAMGKADPNAPPLTPAYALSRTRSLLAGRAGKDYAEFFWRYDSHSETHWGRMLDYHRKGVGRLPVRDVIGLSDESRRWVKQQAWAAWDRLKKGIEATVSQTELSVRSTIPSRKPTKPIAATGRTDLENFTFGIAGTREQVAGALARGQFTGFRQFHPPATAPPPPPKPKVVAPPAPPRPPAPPAPRVAARPVVPTPVPPFTPKVVSFQPKPPLPPPTFKPAPLPKPLAPAPPAKSADALAPYRDWKPAATLGDAKAFLRDHHGVAEIEDADPRDLFGKPFASDGERLKHANTLIAEWNRLRLTYPNLPEKAIDVLYLVDSARGLASVPHKGSKSRELATKGREWDGAKWDRTDAWEAENGRKFTVERRGTQVQDNFRHELAHNLTTKEFYDGFVAASARDDVDDPLVWFRYRVSEYAGTKMYEAIAESFALYTSPNYNGSLPDKLAKFFRDYLGG